MITERDYFEQFYADDPKPIRVLNRSGEVLSESDDGFVWFEAGHRLVEIGENIWRDLDAP